MPSSSPDAGEDLDHRRVGDDWIGAELGQLHPGDVGGEGVADRHDGHAIRRLEGDRVADAPLVHLQQLLCGGIGHRQFTPRYFFITITASWAVRQ